MMRVEVSSELQVFLSLVAAALFSSGSFVPLLFLSTSITTNFSLHHPHFRRVFILPCHLSFSLRHVVPCLYFSSGSWLVRSSDFLFLFPLLERPTSTFAISDAADLSISAFL